MRGWEQEGEVTERGMEKMRGWGVLKANKSAVKNKERDSVSGWGTREKLHIDTSGHVVWARCPDAAAIDKMDSV